MHILLVTGEYPPMQGGVGAYTAELAAALSTQGATVSILGPRHAAAALDAREGERVDAAVRLHTTVERWGWPIWRKAYTLAQAEGADWIHVQYQTAAFGMNPAINLAPVLWRRWGGHVAWTYHDLLPPYLFPKAGARLRRWVTERPAFSADQVIVTNAGDYQQLADRTIARGRTTSNLHKIPIGSNISGRILPDDERTARRRLRGYYNRDLVIGYFGFLNRSKGGATLVQTLQRLVQHGRNAFLLMIGDQLGASDPTNRTYMNEIETMIGALGLVDRVRWTGRQSDAEVSADLNALDVLVMPYEDGASLRRGTLMAGLANGCAIVTTTPQSPLPELEGGRQLLYVAPGDPEAAAQAVMTLADNRTLRDQMRLAAFASSQQFNWESIAAQHMALYADGLRR